MGEKRGGRVWEDGLNAFLVWYRKCASTMCAVCLNGGVCELPPELWCVVMWELARTSLADVVNLALTGGGVIVAAFRLFVEGHRRALVASGEWDKVFEVIGGLLSGGVSGSVKVVVPLVTVGYFGDREVVGGRIVRGWFGKFCENERLGAVGWLHQTFGLTAEDARAHDNRALCSACELGHLEVARWLHRTFGLTIEVGI